MQKNIFYDQHHIYVMINRYLKGKAPPDWGRDDWRRYYRNFTKTKLTPRRLAYEIYKGHSFAPVYNGRRTRDNFAEAWHIAFDFDAGDNSSSLDFLFRPYTVSQYFASFGYSTPSSTVESPRSRVVFIFDEPITDVDYFNELYQALAWRFEAEGSISDPSCKDPLRLYYGSIDCEVVGQWSFLPRVTMDLFISEYRKEKPRKVITPVKVTKAVNSGDVDVSHFVKQWCQNIINAPDGEKNRTRFNNARTAGGYVAGGYLDEQTTLSALIEAARSNSDTPDIAERDVRDAFYKYGKTSPLTVEAAVAFGDVADV